MPEALAHAVGDVDAFLRDAWTRRAHLHHGGQELAGLLPLEAVDRILATMSLRAPAFRLVRDGSPLPPSSYTRHGTVGGKLITDLIDAGRVFDHFADGATIVLQGLHRYWEPVTRFCRELERFLTHPVQANAYITPPVASGLNVHHDTHDVFAVQTHGEKHWVVHEPVVAQPLVTQRWKPAEHDAGEPTLDVHLRPGDCLYVPRGTPHAAATTDQPSVHIAVGIRATTWHDVLRTVLEQAGEEIRFREALPAGYAEDPDAFALEVAAKLKELAVWLENADAGAAAHRTARRFWSTRQPLLDGQLGQVLGLGDIDDDTVVQRRPGAIARLETTDDGRVALQLGDRRVVLPGAARPALERILTAETLRVADLDDLLDASGRLVLIRRLVREGLLTAQR